MRNVLRLTMLRYVAIVWSGLHPPMVHGKIDYFKLESATPKGAQQGGQTRVKCRDRLARRV